MNIAYWLARSANTFSESTAIATGKEPGITYREFARRAAGSASALHGAFKAKPGDRIAVLAGNCGEFIEALYGIWWAGCVAVPINAKLHAREAAFILADAG